MQSELEAFIAEFKALATESADSVDANETDILGELELAALMSAVHAFTAFVMARSMRAQQEADALAAAELN